MDSLHNSNSNLNNFSSGDPNSTTFVQADPSNFRAVVQRLTGATDPAASSSRTPTLPRRSAFKLHERRQTTTNLQITLNHPLGSFVPGAGETVMASPVSTLEVYGTGSPRTPVEEDRAIADKGFYLHPTPLRKPPGSEPQLLSLFPLHSPQSHPSSS